MHLHRPHCRNPIEVDSPDQQYELVCPSCGSSFGLENDRLSQRMMMEYHRQLARFTVVHVLAPSARSTRLATRNSTV